MESVFSKIDLQQGYHQILIRPMDVAKDGFPNPVRKFSIKSHAFRVVQCHREISEDNAYVARGLPGICTGLHRRYCDFLQDP